jgi:hypothetical protein
MVVDVLPLRAKQGAQLACTMEEEEEKRAIIFGGSIFNIFENLNRLR